MRLIDADALIAKAYIMQEPNGFIHSVVTERQIAKAPTIDAVPVVRCKDCKRFFEYRPDYKRNRVEGADGDCLDRIINSDNRQFQGVKYSDFCSYGEKKEADGNA